MVASSAKSAGLPTLIGAVLVDWTRPFGPRLDRINDHVTRTTTPAYRYQKEPGEKTPEREAEAINSIPQIPIPTHAGGSLPPPAPPLGEQNRKQTM